MIVGTGQISEFFLGKINLTPLHHLIKKMITFKKKKVRGEILKKWEI